MRSKEKNQPPGGLKISSPLTPHPSPDSHVRILGIDPGLRVTGFGVIEKNGGRLTYVTSGRIRTPDSALDRRLKTILDGLAEVIAEHQPAQVTIEKVFVNVNPASTLLLGQAPSLEAVAVADSLIAVVPASAFLEMVDGDPRLARALLETLSGRLQAFAADFGARAVRGAAPRLAAYLEALAGPGKEPCTVRLPISKTLVAGRLGMTKETLSRVLARLAAGGLVSVAKREVTLLDRSRLAMLRETG